MNLVPIQFTLSHNEMEALYYNLHNALTKELHLFDFTLQDKAHLVNLKPLYEKVRSRALNKKTKITFKVSEALAHLLYFGFDNSPNSLETIVCNKINTEIHRKYETNFTTKTM